MGEQLPVLDIRYEDGTQQIIELREPIITIGRSVDNVLEIPDANMSRRHCVVEQRESGGVIPPTATPPTEPGSTTRP